MSLYQLHLLFWCLIFKRKSYRFTSDPEIPFPSYYTVTSVHMQRCCFQYSTYSQGLFNMVLDTVFKTDFRAETWISLSPTLKKIEWSISLPANAHPILECSLLVTWIHKMLLHIHHDHHLMMATLQQRTSLIAFPKQCFLFNGFNLHILSWVFKC